MEEENLVEPVEAMVVEVSNMSLVETTEVMVVEFDDDLDPKVNELTKWDYDQKVEEVYPKSGEDLVDFLHRCKIGDLEVMLCPGCSAVFDKKAAEGLEELKIQDFKKKPWVDRRPKFSFNKPQYGDYDAKFQRQRNYWGGKSYIPPAAVPTSKWIRPNTQAGPKQQKWKLVEVGQGSSYNDNSQVSKNYSYGTKNYLGKNPMTRTQWRRF